MLDFQLVKISDMLNVIYCMPPFQWAAPYWKCPEISWSYPLTIARVCNLLLCIIVIHPSLYLKMQLCLLRLHLLESYLPLCEWIVWVLGYTNPNLPN